MSRVLVDMDGTAAGWTEGIEDYLREDDTDVTWLDWSRWDGVHPDAPAAERTILKNAIRGAQRSEGFYWNLSVLPGAVKAIAALEWNGHEVYFCTTPDSLNATCANDKLQWVEHHFGTRLMERTILTHDKTIIRGDYLIDDKPDIAGAAEPSWEQIVFTAPYNRHLDGWPRIDHWSDIEHVLQVVR